MRRKIARFARADVPNQSTLLVSTYVEEENLLAGATERALRKRIGRELRREIPGATLLVDVTVLGELEGSLHVAVDGGWFCA